MNWEKHFKRHIVDRGWDYFCEGAVKNLIQEEDLLTAMVHGTEIYDVQIKISDKKIESIDCTCPYAETGEFCKHAAAVLFKWENDEESISDDDESQIKNSITNSAKELILKADQETINKFMLMVLEDDERLLLRFKNLVNPEISKMDMMQYKRQIDKISYEYHGRGGFIDFYEADGFIDELGDFLYKDVRMMLDDCRYLEAFELTNHIFITLGDAAIDDSAGGTSMLATWCYEIWLEILGKTDIKTKSTLFKWFTNKLDGTVIDYMEEYIENIIMEEFQESEFLKLKLNLTETKLAEAEKQEDSWSKKFYREKWAERHLALMSLNSSSREDLEQFYRKHWILSGIRKHYIARCLEEKRYDEAIGVLKESLMLDSEYRGLLLSHSEKLKELFLMRGEKEQYLDQLWQQAVKYAPGDLEIYKELKAQYSKSDWEEKREELFDLLPRGTSIDKFFREEGLLDRLIAYVVRSPGLYVLKVHEEILKKDYPNELLKKYREEVEAGAKRTTSRGYYKELVSMLRSMKKIAGGNDMVNEIAMHWKTVYKNRRAMMDELSKL